MLTAPMLPVLAFPVLARLSRPALRLLRVHGPGLQRWGLRPVTRTTRLSWATRPAQMIRPAWATRPAQMIRPAWATRPAQMIRPAWATRIIWAGRVAHAGRIIWAGRVA